MDTKGNKVTFDGTAVDYIDTDGTYKLSRNKKIVDDVTNFRKGHEEKTGKNRKRGGGGNRRRHTTGKQGSNTYGTQEEFHQDVLNASDTLANQAEKLHN